ncbi:MAG: ABC transporter ATP-binding protein [Chloroflexota bacterium]
MSESVALPGTSHEAESPDTAKPRARGLWPLMAPVRSTINLGMALAVLSAVATIGALLCIAPIISALLLPQPDTSYIWTMVLLAMALTATAFILRTYAFRISHMGAYRLEQILRTELTAHLARVPLGYIITTGSGTLKKVIQDDVKALHSFVADSTPLMGRAYAAPIATAVVLFIIDWRLALVTLAVLFLGELCMRFAMKDHSELRRQYDEGNERINTAVIEFVQAMPVVRTFDDGTTSFRRYHTALDHFTTVFRHWSLVSRVPALIGLIILSPLPTLLAVAGVGSWMLLQGWITVPVLVAVLLLCTGVAEALMPLMWLTSFIKKAETSALRIQDVLAVPPLPQPINSQTPQDASVRLRDVSFAYEGRDSLVLDQVSIDVPAGTITALVGPSGAGKSTVAQLIPRFWDVQHGAIEVGGVDVRNTAAETLMSHVSFVFQNTFLFHDTIANNIKLGRPDATDAEVEAAAHTAQAHDFIQELPLGYDTIAGERGTRLSGGQRQRITIARAILQNNPIVVLDEATAFADPENEALIVEALANLMHGKTVIIIAHRLATIVDVDQIVVLDQGRVVECGRHAELAAANGIYARLWASYQQAQNWGVRQND